jgi:hypothetical protein
MSDPKVGCPLGAGPVGTIQEVISRLEAIQAFHESNQPLGKQDGVASFNFLYHIITKNVAEKVGHGFFRDDEFLVRLDVAFANRYLNAMRAHNDGSGPVPRSWKILIERRSEKGVTPLQFAVAGVNAHINFDLAPAVVATCEELGRAPSSGLQKEAYEKVNDIFAEEMGKLRQHLQGHLMDWIDEELGRADDIVGEWSVEVARATAWDMANILWAIRKFDIGEDALLDTNDRIVSLANHLLLRSLR